MMVLCNRPKEASMAQMEIRPDSHGKVRDIYDCGDSLLMVD